MKVLLINGSPNTYGCTYTALKEVSDTLEKEGIETEIVQVGHLNLPGCTACKACKKLKKCVHDDIVNILSDKLRTADGLVLGSPVYFSGPNGTLKACLDRMFYSLRFDLTGKVGASVVSARRAGCSSTFDGLNKYFLLCGMPVAPSQYWNCIHGNTPEEAKADLEGLQIMRTLGHNMAFLIKSIALGKEQYGLPPKEKIIRTNFIEL